MNRLKYNPITPDILGYKCVKILYKIPNAKYHNVLTLQTKPSNFRQCQTTFWKNNNNSLNLLNTPSVNVISYSNKKCNLIETSTDACYMQLSLVNSLLHNQYGLFLLSMTSIKIIFSNYKEKIKNKDKYKILYQP